MQLYLQKWLMNGGTGGGTFFHIYWKESVAQVYMHKSLNWSEDMLFKGEVSYYTNIVVTHSEILLTYLVMTKSHKNIFCCCVTFQRVEEFSCGDVKDVDDSINGTTGQIFTIRALKVKIRYELMKHKVIF